MECQSTLHHFVKITPHETPTAYTTLDGDEKYPRGTVYAGENKIKVGIFEDVFKNKLIKNS